MHGTTMKSILNYYQICYNQI